MPQSHVKINLINPGRVRTKMRALAYPGEDPMTVPKPEEITEVFVKLGETSCDLNGQTVNAQ